MPTEQRSSRPEAPKRLAVDLIEAAAAERDDAVDIVMEYLQAIDIPEERRTIEAEVDRHLNDDVAVILLAREGNRTVGCVVVRSIPIDGALEVRRLYVRPEARRRGLARTLVRAAEKYARSRGAAWLYLDSKQTLRNAVRLYESEGFGHIARYNDSAGCDVFMRKSLAG